MSLGPRVQGEMDMAAQVQLAALFNKRVEKKLNAMAGKSQRSTTKANTKTRRKAEEGRRSLG